ncbi:MAG: aquaporin family protein [Burkholderiales bacterium]|nr:MAG: aquaporin family protein [Burkholderiales bacterium]TAG79521.1 MAG: aquaporin family protein [Betaproteobacteria bacterium]
MNYSLSQKLGAEALGSLSLACVVIGSGILAEKLSAGNAGVALIGNTLATVAALGVLIYALGPISGAHFNPAVSLVMTLRRDVSWREFALYVPTQIAAMIVGAMLSHAMFGLALVQTSQKVRSSLGEGIGEFVATFWLLFTILFSANRSSLAPVFAVPAAITAGYWFTSSTSFANPAISIARSLSDTFAGVAPSSVPGFVAAQVLGALAALLLSKFFLRRA